MSYSNSRGRNTKWGPDVRLEPERTPGRRMRRPQHTFRVGLFPWAIQPAYIAPVLPGDSLKSAMLQYRALSGGGINNPLNGWWLEHYMFYCPLAVLDDADDIRAAIVDPAESMGLADAAKGSNYHSATNRPDWVERCMKPIVRAYFRDEGDEASAYKWGNNYVAAIAGSGWWDSLVAASELPTETGSDDWEKSWSIWSGMRRAKLTTSTYEEWLAQQGVSTPPLLRETEADLKVPELLRFNRDFTYPVPTTNQSNGNIVANVQWTQTERVDRARFFSEPGFIVGFFVVRPKVYLANQREAMVNLLQHRAAGWLPPAFDTDPHTALVRVQGSGTTDGTETIARGNGPVSGASVDYVFDTRDLFLHGDQFIYNAMGVDASVFGTVALPTTNLANIKYPPFADLTAVQEWAYADVSQCIDVDGICVFNIASRVNADVT